MTVPDQTTLDASLYLGDVKNLGTWVLNKQSNTLWGHTGQLAQRHSYSKHGFKVRVTIQ